MTLFPLPDVLNQRPPCLFSWIYSRGITRIESHQYNTQSDNAVRNSRSSGTTSAVPSLGRSCRILGISDGLKSLRKDLLLNRKNTILGDTDQYRTFSSAIPLITHRSLSNKVGNRDDFARVSVNESLEPSTSLVILDLNDMSQSDRLVLLDQELEGWRVIVELAIELLLSGSNCLFDGNARSRRRNLG